MAQLSFQALEPVQFGGKDCKINLNQEIKLRIQVLDVAKEDINRCAEIISEAFPDEREYVKEFITANLGAYDLAELQVYLTQGAKAVKDIRDAMREGLSKKISGGDK